MQVPGEGQLAGWLCSLEKGRGLGCIAKSSTAGKFVPQEKLVCAPLRVTDLRVSDPQWVAALGWLHQCALCWPVTSRVMFYFLNFKGGICT